MEALRRFLREEAGMTRSGKVLLICAALGVVVIGLVVGGMMTFSNQRRG